MFKKNKEKEKKPKERKNSERLVLFSKRLASFREIPPLLLTPVPLLLILNASPLFVHPPSVPFSTFESTPRLFSDCTFPSFPFWKRLNGSADERERAGEVKRVVGGEEERESVRRGEHLATTDQ